MKANVTVRFQEAQKPKKFIGWRCLHAAEGGYQSDPRGMPEIRPGLPSPDPVLFSKELQLLSWNLNRGNKLYTKKNWRATYGNTVAFTNTQGFNKAGDPRADFVNMLNVKSPLPKLMKGIICGGMFVRGKDIGSFLKMTPGLHAIDAAWLTPTLSEVLENNWYYEATTQYFGKMSHFPQGHGSAVYIPYVLREETTYPIEWFVPWEEDYLPDPLKIYLTK